MEQGRRRGEIDPSRKITTQLQMEQGRQRGETALSWKIQRDEIGFIDFDIIQYPAILQSDSAGTFSSEIPPIA